MFLTFCVYLSLPDSVLASKIPKTSFLPKKSTRSQKKRKWFDVMNYNSILTVFIGETCPLRRT